jgi:MerR family copper efflux transcriptional regulator
MRIGDLAKRAGITIQSIRFYEREKVLRQPLRTASGYRAYSEHDLEHLVFIKQCQQLGFTLKEIRELADLHSSVMSLRDQGEIAPEEMQRIMAITAERLQTIDEKICSLQQMRERLLIGSSLLAAGRCPAQPLRNTK